MRPVILKTLVASASIRNRFQERPAPIACADQPAKHFIRQDDGIADTFVPGADGGENIPFQHIQQRLHQLVDVIEILIEG